MDPIRKNSRINHQDPSPVLPAQSSRWEEILTQDNLEPILQRPEDLDRLALTPGIFVLLAGFFGSHLSQTKSQVPWQVSSSSHLSVEGDGAGLALGADPLGPGRVSLTPRLDLTADVLQGYKLPSGRAGRGKGGREREGKEKQGTER